MVNGKGKGITDADLVQAASVVDIPKNFVTEAVQRTEEALSRFEALKVECEAISQAADSRAK